MIKNLLLVAIALFTFTSAQAGGFTILTATPAGPFTGASTGHKIKFYVKEVAGSPPAEAFVKLGGATPGAGTYMTGGSITSTATGPASADVTNIVSAVDPMDPYIWVITFDIVAHPVGGGFTMGTNVSIITNTVGGSAGSVSTFTTFSATSLPIELSRFDANVTNSNVNLTWETLSESNNAKFVVERSFNGKDFSTVGELDGAGTTISTKNYTFEDKTASATEYKVAYYRLKNVSYDGREATSKQLAVKLRNTDAVSITSIAPSKSNLSFSADESSDATISIISLSGQVIVSKNVAAEKGLNQVDVDFSNLEKGLYIVNLKTNTSSVNKKFVY